MQPMRIEMQASDPATGAELRRELEALRGQEPAGAELLEDTRPRPQVIDPLVATAIVGVVAGIAGGMGKEIGARMVGWLIEAVRGVAQRRKTKIILSLGDVSLEVDEQTRAQDAAAKLLKVS